METHRYLNAGEKIQISDEYSAGSGWRDVPKFLIGDTVPEASNTQWRRTISVVKQSKGKWYSFLFGK